MWLTEDIIKKLNDWQLTDKSNKSVDIKMNWKGLEVFVYNFRYQEGMFIKEDTAIADIDRMLKEKSEAELLRKYIELRDRFDYNKEGV